MDHTLKMPHKKNQNKLCNMHVVPILLTMDIYSINHLYKTQKCNFNEGCLSIPSIREDVSRLSKIRIRYLDHDFNTLEEEYDGIKARIIQHEYDHLEGVLFTDYLSAIKKRLLKRKLNDISKGNVKVDYRMKFPLKKIR